MRSSEPEKHRRPLPQGNERGVDTIPYLLCGPIGHKDGRDIYHDRRYPIETGNI